MLLIIAFIIVAFIYKQLIYFYQWSEMQCSSATCFLSFKNKLISGFYLLMSTAYFRACIQLVIIFVQVKHVLLTRFQKIRSQCNCAGFRIRHCSYKPVIPRTTCLNDIFTKSLHLTRGCHPIHSELLSKIPVLLLPGRIPVCHTKT